MFYFKIHFRHFFLFLPITGPSSLNQYRPGAKLNHVQRKMTKTKLLVGTVASRQVECGGISVHAEFFEKGSSKYHSWSRVKPKNGYAQWPKARVAAEGSKRSAGSCANEAAILAARNRKLVNEGRFSALAERRPE